jgi:superfamily II DNA or RNA helicase
MIKKHTRDSIQAECLEELSKHHRCSAALSMGVGKTYIGLLHMEREYEKGAKDFLVVAPKLSIFTTWKEEAAKFGLTHLLNHIKFTTYRSLDKQGMEYDCIYLDECHNLLYTHELYLAFYPGKILGLSGTPPRHDSSEKGKMVNNYCPIAYSYVTDDAVEDEILNDYRIIVHLLPLSTAKTHKVKLKKGGFFMTSEKDNYAYWTKALSGFGFNKERTRIIRMKALMEYETKERYSKHLLQHVDDKCIVFCNTTDQADRVCSNSYHSKNKDSETNLEKFKRGEFKCLSAVTQLNEGVNIPNLKYGVIMHAYSNERKASQRIGRLLRLNPDQTAYIHILAYKDTVDVDWVISALSDLDQTKIRYRDAEYKR